MVAPLTPRTSTPHTPDDGAADLSRAVGARLGVGVLAAWTGLVALAVLWGSSSINGKGLAINAAPLVGTWDWHPTMWLAIPTLLAAAVVTWGPRLAATARWRAVPLGAGAAASAWATALAASDGWNRITAPLTTRHEYEPFAAEIGGAGEFLRQFVDRLPDTPVHVQGHPPGAPLVPWALDAIGLGGAGWFAALVIAGWGLAIGTALVAARRVAGEPLARRAAPAMVLLPAALWAGTSADALFAGVLAVGVALLVIGTTRAALLGGGVLGVGMLLTYGAVPIVGIPVLVAIRRRQVRIAVVGLAALVGVLVVVYVLSGFSWLDGLRATREAYYDGVASRRPASYFAIAGNPAALALAVGPAVAVGLVAAVRRWTSSAALLPIAAVLAVGAANASLLSKGEVERIWLLFVPWLALAAPGDRRGWLAAQAVVALVLQAWLRSKW